MQKHASSIARFWAAIGLLTVGACALSDHPRAPHPASAPKISAWEDVFSRPGVIEHQAIVSARWHVPLSGLVDLTHARALRAGLSERDIDIVIPVHVLRHPEFGVFIVDTGVTAEPKLSGAAAAFFGGMVVVLPLSEIIARQQAPLAGVLLTHTHIDHVLGLPDVPVGTPIYLGPGELEAKALYHPLMASTYKGLFGQHAAFRTWTFGESAVAPFSSVIDVFGDSTLFAIYTPGHTAGSTSYIAMTTTGPKLFVGDNAHLWWGWNNGVTPGSYSADHDANAESLAKLKELSDAHPELKVFVGHEMNGLGTGVDPYRVQY